MCRVLSLLACLFALLSPLPSRAVVTNYPLPTVPAPIQIGPGLTVATLPAAASWTGAAFLIQDGNSPLDCTTGTGTNVVLCRSNGTAWANITVGGTTGSIFFAGTNGAPTQNNANLFWDNTNLRLGVGTATPDASGIPGTLLHIAGATTNRGMLNVGSTSAVTGGPVSTLLFSSAATRIGQIDVNTDVTFSDRGELRFNTNPGAGITQRMVITSGGNIGINVAAPSSGNLLQVAGHIATSGTAPTAGACGTTPGAPVGTDNSFSIVAGTTTAACTVTFATTWASAPICISHDTTTLQALKTTTSTTAVTATAATALGGDTLFFLCTGRS